jgi:MYXO-CTERM domain-containing protein
MVSRIRTGVVALVVLVSALAIAAGLHRPPPRNAGQLTAITLPDLAVTTFDGWSKTVRIGPETRIHQGPRALRPEDLQIGQHVRFTDRRAAKGIWEAVEVDVAPPSPRRHSGERIAQDASPVLGLLGLAGLALALRLSRRVTPR